MPLLSAVIIAFNESDIIGRSLTSLNGVADEILVVDSGSDDGTQAICLKHGARVIDHPWQGYSASKNFGNTMASHPWILSLDADEVLSEELRESIISIKQRDWNEEDVLMFNRLTNYCGHWIRHSGWYPDTKIRVWHRDKGYWDGDIHEQVKFGFQPNKIGLKGDLLHYSFPERNDYLRQREHFTTLSAEAMFRQGKRAGLPKVFLAPAIRFVRDYVINRGFLDGLAGWEVCRGTAYGVYLKYRKLRRMHLTVRR